MTPYLNRDRIYSGNCLANLPFVESESIDLVFADPPFNIGYSYDVYLDRMAGETYVSFCENWGLELKRVLKPTGAFWLAIGDEFAAELKVLFTRDLGFTMRSWVVWHYTFGVNCTDKFTRSHVHLFHFIRDPKRFTFNADAIRVPSARQLIYNDKRANPSGRLPDDTWILRPQDAPESFSPESDTWHVPRVAGTFTERQGFHGCQMPEVVMGRIIRACSNPGETVLDPFAGSGTTCAVAKKLGRRFIGFELSADYARKAQERCDGVNEGDSLAGSEEPFKPDRRKRVVSPV
jgi:site-specific DNA-methyltransferase (adenine-specific)